MKEGFALAVPIIEVKNLYKIYKVGDTRVHALDGVDFTINKGEFCAIVGPSGSGKSTLLNMLAGLEKPTKGEIIIDKIHIEHMTENQLVEFRRKRVGFIFQSYNLLKTLNAVENVALPLSFRGMAKKERNAIAEKYLKLVGLEKQMYHMANAMSGGQQQRVGIARALAVNPRIIFADEPTGNLDSKTTMEILKLMRRIVREQQQTLIMVTHDNHLASYADRLFHIVDGKIFKIEELHHEDDLEEKKEDEKVMETGADHGNGGNDGDSGSGERADGADDGDGITHEQ
ncbi:ABC transporter ATP-binding protein [Lachnospiraceae bacterium AM48-27BH]|nr:ABC transporter ATP-binding protein [Lachnospiraceae bacterium AM48-27BH]